MNISDYFTAESHSMMEFLTTNGQGLYIPAYQRQFTWDDSKLKKLFSDSIHGLKKLPTQEDSVTFIGTIIAIHDTTNATVNPPNRTGLPSRVMTIIDGQQRLTSLLMLTTVLHNELSELYSKFKEKSKKEIGDDKDEVDEDWVEETVLQALGDLQKCFIEQQSYGTGDYQWYPRMTRSYQDTWDKRKGEYESPIGKHLFNYWKFCLHKEQGQKYDFLQYVEEKEREEGTVYSKFNKGLTLFKKLIQKVELPSDADQEEIEFEDEILDSTVLSQALLNNRQIPTTIQVLIKAEPKSTLSKLTRLVVFTNFVLKRIGLTIVTSKTEDYAFDIFEALNTTGEPLTAYETFKPKVIYKSTLTAYSDSEFKSWMDRIDDFFDNREDSNKQEITSSLLISFALADSGTKLSSRITDQRAYLKRFDKIPNDQENRQLDFIKNLACTADFYKYVWTKNFLDIKSFTSDVEEQNQAQLCIEFLKTIKHNITHGPLIRYYSEAILAENSQSTELKKRFIEILKACTAFSILWRGSRKGTAGIDKIYRKLMSEGYDGIHPLARVDKKGYSIGELPTANELKKTFLKILSQNQVSGKDDWINLASRLGQYTNNKTVAKFLIIAALHNTVADPENPGLLKHARDGVSNSLTVEKWRHKNSSSIEHVAPQNDKRNGDWSRKEYDQLYNSVPNDLLHCLGNLTILNLPENSALSDRSWKDKRILYRALSAKTPEELEKYVNDAEAIGISSAVVKDIKDNVTYVNSVDDIALYDKDFWTEEIITKRSEVMAALAWDNIISWLKPTD